MLRIALLAVGCCSVSLGILGIFLPVLPTVPLLLLAAACFARSSETFYNWLISHARLGPMISGYLDGKGIPRRAKISAIGLIWLTLSVSVFWVNQFFWLQIFLVIIGAGLTLYLARLPVLNPTDKNKQMEQD